MELFADGPGRAAAAAGADDGGRRRGATKIMRLQRAGRRRRRSAAPRGPGDRRLPSGEDGHARRRPQLGPDHQLGGSGDGRAVPARSLPAALRGHGGRRRSAACEVPDDERAQLAAGMKDAGDRHRARPGPGTGRRRAVLRRHGPRVHHHQRRIPQLGGAIMREIYRKTGRDTTRIAAVHPHVQRQHHGHQVRRRGHELGRPQGRVRHRHRPAALRGHQAHHRARRGRRDQRVHEAARPAGQVRRRSAGHRRGHHGGGQDGAGGQGQQGDRQPHQQQGRAGRGSVRRRRRPAQGPSRWSRGTATAPCSIWAWWERSATSTSSC